MVELKDMAEDKSIYISIEDETLQIVPDNPEMDDYLLNRKEIEALLKTLLEYKLSQKGGLQWVIKTLLQELPSYGLKLMVSPQLSKHLDS